MLTHIPDSRAVFSSRFFLIFRFEAPDECFLFDSAIINRQRWQRRFESANQINLLLERGGASPKSVRLIGDDH